jgi:hypothetical protein
MRLKAAFEGKLQEYMKAEFATAERAVTLGVREATDGLKISMRRQVTSAGLGQRMANTWRGDLYPRGQNSIRAAGMVYTKASRIMEGFENAAVIRSKDGWWLAIPTPNAPKRGVGGKRINPSNFPEHSCALYIAAASRPCWWLIMPARPTAGKMVSCGASERPATVQSARGKVLPRW